MTDAPTLNVAAVCAELVDRTLAHCIRSIEGLSEEEMHHIPYATANSIGFNVWHVARTIDNVLFFVFDRETPLWLQQGFNDRFDLPKVAQGTGMSTEEAQALHFPEPALFKEYLDALRVACRARLEAATDEYFAGVVLLKPWGERSRLDHLGQVLIAHGNQHLGMVSTARALLGHGDLGF